MPEANDPPMSAALVNAAADTFNLNRLAYFAAVVETGSFTRAAALSGVTKAVVSQQVTRLEEGLGIALLVRSTRRVAPTEAGRLMYARCRIVLDEAAGAFEELTQAASVPVGTLRITAPNDYGGAVVVPVAADFSRRHPQCGVRITMSDQRFDLFSGDWDLAIRLGVLTDSDLKAQRIGSFRELLVGGPAFKAQVGVTPASLATLPFIANTALTRPLDWTFTARAGSLGAAPVRQEVHMREVMGIDATPAVLEAVLTGLGMAVMPEFLVREHLVQGRLVHLLEDWVLPAGGIHVVYPSARHRPSKVRVFVEMLKLAAQHPFEGL